MAGAVSESWGHSRALGFVSRKNRASSGSVATWAPDFAACAAAARVSSTAEASSVRHAFLPWRLEAEPIVQS